MEETVTLSSSGESGSIRFIIPPPTIDALGLQIGDIVEFEIKRIFKDKDQTIPETPDFIPKIRGNVISAGGSSLGVTIRKNYVKRYNLKENYDLVIDIILQKKKESII